jgi:hypothetical protein
VRQRFGGFTAEIASGLSVRHDHGSQYMSDDFQAELAFLGIASSPAFVRAPEGNGCTTRQRDRPSSERTPSHWRGQGRGQ